MTFPTLKELDKIVADWIAEGGLDRFEAEQTPEKDGTCKKENCGGKVVCEVLGIFRGQISYASPACKKCGRGYLFATNAPKVGAEEFLDSLRRPVTI